MFRQGFLMLVREHIFSIDAADFKTTNDLVPISQCLLMEDAMADYYRPEHLELARKRFESHSLTRGSGTRQVDEGNTTEAFQGFPSFSS